MHLIKGLLDVVQLVGEKNLLRVMMIDGLVSLDQITSQMSSFDESVEGCILL